MARRVAGGSSALLMALILGCNSQTVTPVADVALPGAATTATAADGGDYAPTPPKPKVYDVDADGFAQIEDALKIAKAADKRVLLQFGAEWCGWCHKLHHLFAEDETIADALAADYVVVLIDVDGDHNAAVNDKYGDPTQHGLPVIVVLDADGTQLTTQDTAKLEEGDHHDPALVLTFLEEWAPGGPQASDAATSEPEISRTEVSQN